MVATELWMYKRWAVICRGILHEQSVSWCGTWIVIRPTRGKGLEYRHGISACTGYAEASSEHLGSFVIA